MNLSSTENDEPVEVKSLQISLTNQSNLFVTEVSSLYTQKRGGVGNKFKMNPGEYVLDTKAIDSNEELLLFTQDGDVYHCATSQLEIGVKTYIGSLVNCKEWQKIRAITSINPKHSKPNVIFITKKGFIKKSELSEYNLKRSIGLRALTLDEGDEIVEVLFSETENIGLLTQFGNFIMITTSDIRAIGRVAKGIHGIKLNDGDEVISAHVIPSGTKFIASISGSGLFKKTSINEFSIQGKNTKGSKLQKLNEGDWMADFMPLSADEEILIASTSSCIRLRADDIPIFSKGALGNKSIKLNPKDNVVKLTRYE